MTRDRLRQFLRDEQGATAIEYALIAAGIGAVIVTAVNLLGGTVTGQYVAVNARLTER
jgi:pilus assembly protein Flp/PilA